MSPLDRLLAEELPTGTFGHAQPPQPAPRPIRPWTPEEQARHWAELGEALEGWHWEGGTSRRSRRRHLRALPAA